MYELYLESSIYVRKKFSKKNVRVLNLATQKIALRTLRTWTFAILATPERGHTLRHCYQPSPSCFAFFLEEMLYFEFLMDQYALTS